MQILINNQNKYRSETTSNDILLAAVFQ